MKKLISALMIILLIAVLFGCGKECEHSWELINDTANCVDDGIKTYECSVCGETKTEISSSTLAGHCWKKVSSLTPTCTAYGIDTYECENCKEIIQNYITAEGHSYNSTGKCQTCGYFKYAISPSVSLPSTYSYIYYGTYHCYSQCQITKVDYAVQDDYLVILYYGIKTYDEISVYGNAAISFTCVLKDTNGNIISSDHVYISGLVVGQKFGENGYYRKAMCNISSLSTQERYVLEIVDRII